MFWPVLQCIFVVHANLCGISAPTAISLVAPLASAPPAHLRQCASQLCMHAPPTLPSQFQTSSWGSEPRRPECNNLYDVFNNIRDDEGGRGEAVTQGEREGQ